MKFEFMRDEMHCEEQRQENDDKESLHFFPTSLGARLNRLFNALYRAPSQAAILLVRFYQVCISPMIGPTCRFHPTCSQYCILAIKKYGLVVGALKTAWRILRCNPFNPGGYDPP